MSDMADVLRKHSPAGMSGGTHLACRCNRAWVLHADYQSHLEAEFTAAGFGLVREAQAVAWDESSRAIKATIGGYTEEGVWAFEQAEKLIPNPYRAVTERGGE